MMNVELKMMNSAAAVICYHGLVDPFHKGAKMINLYLNEGFCVKITRKRGIVYQNHSNTRSFVLKMMNFAGLENADATKVAAAEPQTFVFN